MPAASRAESIEAPAPTAWPFVTAVGVTLGFAGLVTHAAVSAVGIVLALAGFVGWMREVFPVRAHRDHPAPRPGASGAARRPRAVARSSTCDWDEGAHRVRVPVAVRPYSAGVKAGARGRSGHGRGGAPVRDHRPGKPLVSDQPHGRGRDALAGGSADLAQLRAFNAVALGVGIIVHGALSILVGLLYAVILPTLPRSSDLVGRFRGARAVDGPGVVDARPRESRCSTSASSGPGSSPRRSPSASWRAG